jgi:betaine-aldehyde dehydrogenase
MAPLPDPKLPQTDHFYGGKWHAPLAGRREKTYNPGNGKLVTDQIAWGDKDDVDAAVTAAQQAFPAWAATPALQRASYLRKAAEVLRAHDEELALIDAVNTGNPVKEMKMDVSWLSCSLPSRE